jgi:O-antigen ligase
MMSGLAWTERWPTTDFTGWKAAPWVGLAAALAGVAVSFSPWVAVLAAGALIWSWLVVRHWSIVVPLTLAVSVAIPRYVYTVGGLTLNAERVLLPTLFGVFVLRNLGKPLVHGRAHLLLLLSLGVTALSSVVNAPDNSESLRLTLLIAIACAPFWLLPNIAPDMQSVRRATLIFVSIGVVEAVFGQVAVAANTLLDVNLGVQLDSLTSAWAAYGSQWEGNTFGSFVAAAAAMTMGWMVWSNHTRRTRVLGGVALAVLAGGLVASLSRGAWLGVGAGAIVVVLYMRPRWKIAGLAVALVALVGMMTLGDPAQPSSADPGQAALTRLSLLSDPIQGNLDGIMLERLYIYDLAFHGWLEQPIIGWGAGALGQRFSYLSLDLPAWVGNLELHALHDSGLLGALGLLGVMGGTIVSLIRALRRQPGANRANRGLLVGLLASCVTLLVAYQTTEATWLGYTWYVFGLAWAGARASGIPADQLSVTRAIPAQRAASPEELRREAAR